MFKINENLDWPKTAPILEEKDIHKGSIRGPNNTRCLLGHRRKWLGLNSYNMEQITNDAIIIAGSIKNRKIAVFNDEPHRSKKDLAKTWNRAMALLGYTEGNPEAKFAARYYSKKGAS